MRRKRKAKAQRVPPLTSTHTPTHVGPTAGTYPHWTDASEEGAERRKRRRELMRASKMRNEVLNNGRGARQHKGLRCFTIEEQANPVTGETRQVYTLKREYQGHQKVEVMIDSGAADSVMPAGLLGSYPILEGLAAKSGVKYQSADGSTMPNLGEQKVAFVTSEGHSCNLTFQVADVHKPLIAATQLTAAGNEVRLYKNGGRVINPKTGKEISFGRKNGVYVLNIWVKPGPESDFHRPGA